MCRVSSQAATVVPQYMQIEFAICEFANLGVFLLFSLNGNVSWL